ncbi:putative MRN complex-interacting protein [Medicago truncatula]|uniref:Putative MRN complex-interacting protein n=1 Tax=Medicago truncatula TaxID=3880 RepID=A0A396HJ34_MEDTR|nr:uncharacterized protein LOC120575994 [Medicago truncatula]RHN51255.1 putative MRN complex-interacting protein [Medicago truncatula]
MLQLLHHAGKAKEEKQQQMELRCVQSKQSVRKIFAQGYKAKDIRSFVQSVNMSRKSIEEDDQQQWLLAGTLNPTPEEHVRGEYEFPADFNNKKNCTTDWSVYLDNDDHRATERDEQQQHEDDFEPLVVTELPNGMLKKRKSVDNSTPRCGRRFKSPLFQNSEDAGEPVKDQRRITVLTESNSQRNSIVTSANQRTQKCKQAINTSTSKWNDYLAEDNLEHGYNKRGFNFKTLQVHGTAMTS